MRVLLPVLLMLGVAAPAHAGVRVGAGLADEIDGESSTIVSLSWVTEQRHPWEFMLGRLGARDELEGGPVDATVFVSASKRFTWHGWFAQGGIAWADADNAVLSEHWQFHTGAGWSGGDWTFSLRHLSNANTGGRNRGETLLLVEYGF